MKKMLSLLLVLILAGALCVGCAETGSSTGVEDGVLTVAMECAYAPYNWTQTTDANGAVPIKGASGEYANGYDVMMAKRICEANGWTLEIVRLDWDSLVPAVQTGQIDAVIAGQSMTSERAKQVDFAGPYLYASIVVLTRKDSPVAGAKTLAELSGASCTSQMGTVWYDTCLPQIKDADIKAPKDSAPTMLMALETGDVDFVCTDMPTAQGAMVVYDDMIVLELTDGFEVSDEEVNIGISVQKGNTFLKDKINAVLEPMTEADFNALMAEATKVQPLSQD